MQNCKFNFTQMEISFCSKHIKNHKIAPFLLRTDRKKKETEPNIHNFWSKNYKHFLVLILWQITFFQNNSSLNSFFLNFVGVLFPILMSFLSKVLVPPIHPPFLLRAFDLCKNFAFYVIIWTYFLWKRLRFGNFSIKIMN